MIRLHRRAACLFVVVLACGGSSSPSTRGGASGEIAAPTPTSTPTPTSSTSATTANAPEGTSFRCGAPLPRALPELNGLPGIGSTRMAGQMTEAAATAKRLFDAERWAEAVPALIAVYAGQTGDDAGNRDLAEYHLGIAYYRLHREGDAANVFVGIARARAHLKHAETLLWIYKLVPEVPGLVRALVDYEATDVERFDNPNQRELYWGLSYLLGRERLERGQRAEAAALFAHVDAASTWSADARACLGH